MTRIKVFRIGFEKLDSSKTDTINKFLTKYNIPLDMVSLVETGKLVQTSGSRVTVNPIKGGAEIGVPDATWSSPPPVCTVGFIVKTSSGAYNGLTAGHCQDFTHGKWDNGLQAYYQPYGGRYIGNEIAGTMKTAHSDSLRFTTSETGGFGQIYQYNASPLTITNKGYTQIVGDWVCTSGTGSGSTRCGYLLLTGVTTYANGQSIGHANTNLASFVSTGGDSGSPVWNTNGGINVYGILFATDSSGSYYSTISGIEADQGVLQFK